MSDPSENFTEQAAAMQKLWWEAMSKVMRAALATPPESAPPELLRQIRSGILQALAEAWNEFLRSPQFQEGMKKWMEQAVAFRKMSNDFMAKARKEMQAPTSSDVDAIMLAVRHMETRVLDRLEELEKRVGKFEQPPRQAPTPRNAARAAKGSRPRERGKKKAGTS